MRRLTKALPWLTTLFLFSDSCNLRFLGSALTYFIRVVDAQGNYFRPTFQGRELYLLPFFKEDYFLKLKLVTFRRILVPNELNLSFLHRPLLIPDNNKSEAPMPTPSRRSHLTEN